MIMYTFVGAGKTVCMYRLFGRRNAELPVSSLLTRVVTCPMFSPSLEWGHTRSKIGGGGIIVRAPLSEKNMPLPVGVKHLKRMTNPYYRIRNSDIAMAPHTLF